MNRIYYNEGLDLLGVGSYDSDLNMFHVTIMHSVITYIGAVELLEDGWTYIGEL